MSPEYLPEIPDVPDSESALTEYNVSQNEKMIQQVSGSVSQEATSPEHQTTQTNSVSLEQSVRLALTHNPDLVALRQSENVSSAARGVAQTYPFNPFVQVQVTPWQDQKAGGPGATYHYVLLMQTIQLAHQQQFREQAGSFTLNSTRWNIHQAELQTLAQTDRLYFSALYQRGVKDLTEAGDRNNRQLLRILERQLEAGAATAADVAIVRVDAASTRQQLLLATANYQTALRDLSRQIGVLSNAVVAVTGDLRSIEWRLPGFAPDSDIATSEQILAAGSDAKSEILPWAASRPDVMAARSDVDVARAGLSLASASKTPDLQIGPYYQTTADSTQFLGFRGQIDLPVINTGEPLERQRMAEHHQRLTAGQQTLRRAELEAEAAFERYVQALAIVNEESPNTVLDLPAELEGLENQFLAGEVDIVRITQARTSLTQNQRAGLNLLNELAQSAAALTGATGIPIEQIAVQKETSQQDFRQGQFLPAIENSHLY